MLMWLAAAQPNEHILNQLLNRSEGWYDPKRYEGDSPLQHLLRHSEGELECVRKFLRHGLSSLKDGPLEVKYALEALGYAAIEKSRSSSDRDRASLVKLAIPALNPLSSIPLVLFMAMKRSKSDTIRLGSNDSR